MALVAVRVLAAQAVVGAGNINGGLVVQGTAADIVDLLDNVPGAVPVVLAAGCVRSKVVDVSGGNAPVLVEVVAKVPGTAEAKGLLGAVLLKSRSVCI